MYRPWGRFDWILDRLSPSTWDVLACLSTEDRSLATWTFLRDQDGRLGWKQFVVIDDAITRNSPLSDEQLDKHEDLILKNQNMVLRHEDSDVIEMQKLFNTDQEILEFAERAVSNLGEDVVLDITSFPKRFFFPLVKTLIRSDRVKNLLVTYSIAERYTTEPLAYDPEEWCHLPTFGDVDLDDDSPELAFAGVGFLPFGLPGLLKGRYSKAEVKMMFPFPSSPPNYQRNWDFMRLIEDECRQINEGDIIRVGIYDASTAFDHIKEITDSGSKSAIFAPYGPKPISLAMCLYAIGYESSVYYTQPRMYHPEYSTGVAKIDGIDLIYAYCIKLDGRNLYS